MAEVSRFGVVALVGRANVGKSSLLNRLVGQKLSIVSRRPQTTWRGITGICSTDEAQIVFVDSPGLHKPRRQALSKRANQAARGADAGAHVICQVIDGRFWTDGDREALKHFRQSEAPLWLLINKIDLLQSREHVLPLIERLQSEHPWAEVVPISAKTGYNVDHLTGLLASSIPEGISAYDDETLSTLPTRFLVAEFIREQIFRQMGDEIPYVTGVEVTQYSVSDDGFIEIDATLWCETAGQKASLIGLKGSRLKAIGTSARGELERFLGQRVRLNQHVKVKKNWAEDGRLVSQLGYAEF
jgi:GTP-binding protein Era